MTQTVIYCVWAVYLADPDLFTSFAVRLWPLLGSRTPTSLRQFCLLEKSTVTSVCQSVCLSSAVQHVNWLTRQSRMMSWAPRCYTWKLANLGVAVSLVCSPQYKQVYIVTDTQNASHLKSRSIIKPPLATARAASCDGPVHLFVCLYVCLSVAKMQKRDFLKN